MAERIKNIPSPDILMNSLRSIGYSFKTALADIIDNSISVNAKNIWIDFPSYTIDLGVINDRSNNWRYRRLKIRVE